MKPTAPAHAKSPSTNKQNEWDMFKAYAKEIDPIFSDKGMVAKTLKKMGYVGFNLRKSEDYCNSLREFAGRWNAFVLRATEINRRMYSKGYLVGIAISEKYGDINLDDEEGMLNACAEYAHEWEQFYGWAMPCPICGKPTIRYARYDAYNKHKGLYGLSPADDCGWECVEFLSDLKKWDETNAPYEARPSSHFFQYKSTVFGRRIPFSPESNRITDDKKFDTSPISKSNKEYRKPAVSIPEEVLEGALVDDVYVEP